MTSRTSSSTTRRVGGPASAIVFALALLFALVGCGSDGDDASAVPTPTASTSGSVGDDPTDAPPQTASTPTVEPATGPRIAVRGLRVNAPGGWEAKRPYAVMASAFPVGVIGTTVYVFRFPNSGLLALDELAEASRAQGDWKFKLKRLDDVVLDDQPAFHLAGKPNPGVYMEKFGALVNDDRLTLAFEFHNGEDKAYRDEVISSVLATVDFGG